ncbi:transcription termination factor 2-like [Sinocyclocheilus rhinocerous]|uniref:transcription termination factor 2-like n=1 Tax=Sinocyclocheilus rhinocerous TaxID=307959 RepID=UPI0007B97B54|nr:PREDICTED: transcription termination factor 2-like [Sinocyclocheilus rhinocerous]
MERTLCETHGGTCLLKTGVKEGPNKGKSFYICTARDATPCNFTLPTEIPPSHCLQHEDSTVELQSLIYNEKQDEYKLFYRCLLGKTEGQKWCGCVPWREKDPEKRTDLSDKDLQSSSPTPVRNPFKVKTKHNKSSERKRDPDAAKDRDEISGENKHVNGKYHGSAKKKEERSKTTEVEGNNRNGSDGQSGLDREGKDSGGSESWRNKTLPAGMKIKKRVSNDERLRSKAEDGACPESPNSVNESVQRPSESKTSLKDQQEKKPTKTGSSPQIPSKSSAACDKKASVENETKDDRSNKQSTANLKSVTDKTQSLQSKSSSPSYSTSQDVPVSEKPTALNFQKTVPNQSQAKDQKGIARFGEWSDEEGDVQLVSVQPPTQQSAPTPAAPVQKTLTSFPGFQPASKVQGRSEDPSALHSHLSAQLKQKKATLSVVNVSALPDKGERLKSQVKELEEALESLSLTTASLSESQDKDKSQAEHKAAHSHSNPFSRPGGAILLPTAPAPMLKESSSSSLGLNLSQGYSQMFGVNAQNQAFYGGRMTENRLLAVRSATTEAIDHLHDSLESCPTEDTESPDPKGIKVELLPHQRIALAWLLWRETQKPCGGILADDMGLGKTLTMISLILSQKKKDEKLEEWISKKDSTIVASQGTLIICPASLLHHWKKEIDKHVKSSRLSVYLYHGPNRQRSSSVLAEHDVVITTYSLVSKEIPVQKEDAEKPSQDSDHVASDLPPLLRVSWARVILDEAHNIKNPKVQTSMAVCKLRARSRWAVTGTPIQNNLLDMYSLLKFLRCSPFDEYKLWKAQVDNGSKRGGDRLNILTRALLLRRTKDQRDATGKPLVSLPDRTCEVHRLKLSEDEQAVYDVVFAQSRSTLQNYLKRHEEGNIKKGDNSNPFEKVAREFGMSQQDSLSSSQQPQASSTIHILSLLLRLRQCCCHLSLLKKTLDQSELQGDGVALSLEEQLCALSLSEPSDSDPKDTVSLNGSRFSSELFQDTRESTKVSAILTELREIRKKNQKSVIVSQWTSMLHIVAVHLKKMGLKFAVIDGTVNPKRRMDLVEEFNTNPKGPQVMLVSLCAGGVGINLIGGNHLFLIDMHWNPALEDQACDRIYRVGQSRDVTIHRFVCDGTVEDKISSLQEKKKELAQKVLSGTGSSFTKLSLADLRVIFGV